ncbi:membrane-anchored junction protein [Spea bombifrons]|uniref:membrane-anchored junction protein n=1 Tax=Spea bombifrons TaxID=233779 RepID=UPI00234AE8BC|nr:membrane-anchored junction protein [Spea bombifrons]
MSLKPFSFPFPETRFFHTKKYVYKFRIRYGTNFNVQAEASSKHITEEIEASIRAVLANHDNLHPFSTKSFIIFPYKSKWDSSCRLRFKHGPKSLLPFSYIFTIYIEPKSLLLDEKWPVSENFRATDNKNEKQEILCERNCGKMEDASEQDTSSSFADDAQKGGILKFLTSLMPFRFLSRRRNSN